MVMNMNAHHAKEPAMSQPMTPPVLTEIRMGVGYVTLNRPERHNAFNAAMIAALEQAFQVMGANPAVRVVVLAARGASFCAGADLEWMKAAAAQDEASNLQDARQLAAMLQVLASLPKPVIACVQGAAYGGGVGLVAACDIAMATQESVFALSEVRLGLIPATIAPYVIAAIGVRQAQRYMLTAERFSARVAQDMGLLHEVVVDADALDARLQALLQTLLANGPAAMAACKRLLAALSNQPVSADLVEETARRIAATRATAEAQEGLAAFFERRAPGWQTGG
jgi:methylglutaconyl-CoA hydratase